MKVGENCVSKWGRCSKWCDPELDKPCYHQTFLITWTWRKSNISTQQLGNILTQWMQPLADIHMQLHLKSKEDAQWLTGDNKNQLTQFTLNFGMKKFQMRKLTYKLIVWDMPIPELLIDQQMALQDVMKMEHQYLELGEAIAACNKEHINTIALINNVPCILHLENRTSINCLVLSFKGDSAGLSTKICSWTLMIKVINLMLSLHRSTILPTLWFLAPKTTLHNRTAHVIGQPQCELGIICLDNMKTQK